ncbi:MAG: FkbM family methyltransferase [Alphaproteobacteria bacterium]|nr:FkbM family methyltransferase [Alphaproteobacteria bacterium]
MPTPQQRERIRHILTHGFRYFAKNAVVRFLPRPIQGYFAAKGYPKYVGPDIEYIGNVFGGNYLMYANSSYSVDTGATSKTIDREDAFLGIRMLNVKGCVALDIGANVGTYSLGLASLGAKKIYAIEPGPLFPKLQKNIELNGLNNQIIPFKVGLALEVGELLWFEDEMNPGNAILLTDRSAASVPPTCKLSNKGISVPVLPLQDFLLEHDIPDVDFIKIDVEAMEWDVIRSGQKYVSDHLPTIVMETHRGASDTKGYDMMTPMFNFFYELGYETYKLDGDRLVKFIYPNFAIDTFFIHKDKKAQVLPQA